MTFSSPQAQALIASWRTMRRAAADVGLAYAGKPRGYEAAGCCEALERCADELEAILVPSPPTRYEAAMALLRLIATDQIALRDAPLLAAAIVDEEAAVASPPTPEKENVLEVCPLCQRTDKLNPRSAQIRCCQWCGVDVTPLRYVPAGVPSPQEPPELAKLASEIRSSYGFVMMRVAVCKDAQDAYDVMKAEWTDHEAAFRRLGELLGIEPVAASRLRAPQQEKQ